MSLGSAFGYPKPTAWFVLSVLQHFFLSPKTASKIRKENYTLMATKKKINTVDTESYYNEPVPVMLIKDNAKYKDDVTVTVNGTNYQIQRGVQVMVPRKVALVLERSYKQEKSAQEYLDSLKG